MKIGIDCIEIKPKMHCKMTFFSVFIGHASANDKHFLHFFCCPTAS